MTILAVALIGAMTLICVLGTDLSARFQNILIGAQVGALLFAVVALGKVASGDAPDGSIDPSPSWLNPFEIDATSALIAGVLTGVFIYCGWESAVNLTEEVEDSATAPGRAAVLSTVILLVTYVSVAVAVVAFAGLDRIAEFEDDDAILSTLATDVLGTPWHQLVVLAVLTSALASTQTTILPASRTTLSMGRAGAMPRVLASIHPRFRTPHVSTWLIGALAALWYPVVNSLSENFLFDTRSALSLMIAFYYALSGIACVVYYRNELTRSVKNFLFIGVAPLSGAVILSYLLVRSVLDLSDPEASYTGSSVLGVGVPLFIGAAFLALGAILMVLWRIGGRAAASSAAASRRCRATSCPARRSRPRRRPACAPSRTRGRRSPGRHADAARRLARRALIVVGSYGESPMRGAILGSTPHKLLHLSERPVLAVPAPRAG